MHAYNSKPIPSLVPRPIRRLQLNARSTPRPGIDCIWAWLEFAQTSEFLDFDGAIAYALSCTKQEGLTLLKEQAQALKLLSEGRDVFVWFPTGYGKSLCYHF